MTVSVQALPARESNAGLYALVIAAVIALLIGIRHALSAGDDGSLLDWSFTHWAFTYDHGFVKRSFVGELLSHVVDAADLRSAAHLISLAVAALVALALLSFFWRPYLATRSRGALLFALIATVHSATLTHFFYDLGRLDAFGLLLALGCLATIERLPRAAPFVVLIAGLLGILVHEAFIVMYVPLIFAYWIARSPERAWITPARLVVGAALVAAAFFMMTRGDPAIPVDEYRQALVRAHGDWINLGSLKMLYGGVETESPRALALLFDKHRLVQHALLGAALFPLLWIAIRAWRTRKSTAEAITSPANRNATLLLVASVSPLALYLIGIDFARWWALALTNLFVAISLSMSQSPRLRAALDNALVASPVIVWLAIGTSLVCGPLGVASSAFPWLQPHVEATIDAGLHWVRGDAGS